MAQSRGWGIIGGVIGTLLVAYVIFGGVYWIERTVIDVANEEVCSRSEAIAVDQVLGFDNSGLTRIIAWGPSFYQAVVKHGFAVKELFVPSQCVTKGTIEIGSTRCSCQITPRSDNPALQRQMTICGTAFTYWAKANQTCQSARPAICCPQRGS